MRRARRWAVAAAAAAGCATLTPPGEPRTASISPEPPVAVAVVATPSRSWALDRIDQRGYPLDSTFRRRGTGRGVTVYVFDGGIAASHPELAGRVRRGYTAFPDDPPICNGHGTAVAGAIAGRTMGVAPDAGIVDVKMIGCVGARGTVAAVTDAVRWVIDDHAERGGPAIVNWSFVIDSIDAGQSLRDAVSQLIDAGISVIVAAGNFDVDACRLSPANISGALVVGATGTVPIDSAGADRTRDWRQTESAWGDCIDLYAPGVNVQLPGWDSAYGPMVQLWTGTSFATGYASGAAALHLEAHPLSHPHDVIAALKKSATHGAVTGAHCDDALLLYVGSDASRIER
jgi:subtilisin family serine protease